MSRAVAAGGPGYSTAGASGCGMAGCPGRSTAGAFGPGTVGSASRTPERSAQFLPFSALSGFEQLVAEQMCVTELRHELTPEDQERISYELRRVRLHERVRVVHYTVNSYVSTEGTLVQLDPAIRMLQVGLKHICFEDIWSIEPL